MRLKKLLTIALSAAMAVTATFGGFMSTSATKVSANTLNGFTTTADFGANSGLENLSGNFDVTYNYTLIGGSFAQSAILELRDATQCLDFRSDIWGWYWSASTNAVSFTDSEKAITLAEYDSTTYTNFWAALEAARANGIKCSFNVKRTDSAIIAVVTEGTEEDDGITVQFTYTIPNTLYTFADEVTVTLSAAANVTVSDIEFVNSGIQYGTATSIAPSIYFGKNTGYEALTGDFDVTYSYHEVSTGTDNWNAAIVQLIDDSMNSASTLNNN